MSSAETSKQNSSAIPSSGSQSYPSTSNSKVPTEIVEQYSNFYRHNLQPIPPYALDNIAKCHLKDDNNINNGTTDPFLQSVAGNWNNFLKSVEANPAYINGKVKYDDELWKSCQQDLNGKWGGDERLRRALNDNSKINQNDSNNKEYRNSLFFWNKKSYKNYDNPYLRSTAGYWMSDEKRKDWKPTIKRLLLSNVYIPLTFRGFMLVLSTIALGLASRVFVLSRHRYDNRYIGQEPSTIMAICVQSFAIIYLLYIAYDEYNGKPLGLRDPLAKMRLILLDLLFIIFSSANLSLAFNTLFDDRWVCESSTYDNNTLVVSSICERQRGLAAFLFLILCMWVITFTISIVRVVGKVASPIHS
ncbi:hypothetical protein PACTADRAFT_51591 [Pachysolen tannophilus NRRL Y-2460]|uniref:Regulator of phospholipase D SRF1 n=1 Tax=Pachysolen tannophilus NRRL Y-2460 TaxID=669874 RepID=A0A1E4TQ15_PACTA|nr:hypothetical protein PACTADRAFT_51591 [Pachysolen tannophilus NRRL Y-2460]